MGNVMPVSAVRRPCRPGSLYPPNVYSEWAPHVDLSRVDLSKIDSYWGHLVFKDPKLMKKLFPAPCQQTAEDDYQYEETVKLLDDRIKLMKGHYKKLKVQETHILRKIEQCEKERDSKQHERNQNRIIYDIELSAARRQRTILQDEVDRANSQLEDIAYETECNFEKSRQSLDQISELESEPEPLTNRQWWAVSIACFACGLGIGLVHRWMKN